MKQNITLAIEKPLLKRARAIAVQSGKSISGLLSEELTRLAQREAAYARARSRALAHLNSPFRLGGARMADREALHGRKSLR